MVSKKEESVAILTIKSPGKMTPAGRKNIVKWLLMNAQHLQKHGKDYTEGRFIARYIYAGRKKV